MTPADVAEDTSLRGKRVQLVLEAAKKLAEAHMIAFDQDTDTFAITDLGRIAAKFYIRYASIEIFNKEFRSKMTEADVLKMLSMSTEVSTLMNASSINTHLLQFDQIQVRENEIKELEQIMEIIPCEVKVCDLITYSSTYLESRRMALILIKAKSTFCSRVTSQVIVRRTSHWFLTKRTQRKMAAASLGLCWKWPSRENGRMPALSLWACVRLSRNGCGLSTSP